MTPDEWKELLVAQMERLVPGEEYSVNVEKINGQFKFELESASKRAMVAWAEISFHLEDCINQSQQDETLGFE